MSQFLQGSSLDSATPRVDLAEVLTDGGAATSADPGTEQDAMAEYLLANFNAGTPFNAVETPASEDRRIQNLAVRADNVLDSGVVFTGTTGTDVFSGGAGDDDISGKGGSDRLLGQDGDDVLSGGAGGDRLVGGAGDDELSGEGGNDRLVGQDGDDILNGGGGRDRLFGRDGDDTLTGGKASDIYIGGNGADIFVLEDTNGRDLMRDFDRTEDQLGLSDGLSFNALEFIQSGNSVRIGLEEGGLLAIVRNVSVADLTRDVFTAA